MDDAFVITTVDSKSDEAADARRLVANMYVSWAERRGIEKSHLWSEDCVVYKGAWPRLKGETGWHRVSRVSTFDPQRRRHTVFVGVRVLREAEPLPKKDCYRGDRGPGGAVDRPPILIHKRTGACVYVRDGAMPDFLRLLAAKVASGGQDAPIAGMRRSYVLDPYQMIVDSVSGARYDDVNAVLLGDIDRFLGG